VNPVVNIAAYKFVSLEDLSSLRRHLKETCDRLELHGSILLSEEGINLFVAGERGRVDELLSTLRSMSSFSDLEVKESFNDFNPFTRMLVRIKREIIAFGVEEVDPRRYTSRRVPPQELKTWLDEGRPLTLLDTRNDYEVKLGTFRNALAIGVDEFRDFPSAVARLPEDLKKQPVVTFCTGGIRCEKAAPYLELAGFENVYQLDGGILKYFEQCGGAHYEGDCFVFDHRVAVDPQLRETDARMCFACQAPLTREECISERYQPGVSCPYCHHLLEQRMAMMLEQRNAALRAAATPLPGSIPYENYRPIRVGERHEGMSVIDFLDSRKTIHSREAWLGMIAEGRILLRGEPVGAEVRLRAGQRLQSLDPACTEPDVCAGVTVIHEDDSIVVLNKPGCLPMHPCGRFNRNTLQYLLRQAFHPLKIRPAHRLDANTSGVVICSRTRKVAAALQPQFERGEVEKIYLCRVRGHPKDDEFVSEAAISREPTQAGARVLDENGLPSSTAFRVIRRAVDGTSLIEARPKTGRTNQIRIHLWAGGFPILGDPLYLEGGRIGDRSTLTPEDAPMCLHAHEIRFQHPETLEATRFQGVVPEWADG